MHEAKKECFLLPQLAGVGDVRRRDDERKHRGRGFKGARPGILSRTTSEIVYVHEKCVDYVCVFVVISCRSVFMPKAKGIRAWMLLCSLLTHTADLFRPSLIPTLKQATEA